MWCSFINRALTKVLNYVHAKIRLLRLFRFKNSVRQNEAKRIRLSGACEVESPFFFSPLILYYTVAASPWRLFLYWGTTHTPTHKCPVLSSFIAAACGHSRFRSWIRSIIGCLYLNSSRKDGDCCERSISSVLIYPNGNLRSVYARAERKSIIKLGLFIDVYKFRIYDGHKRLLLHVAPRGDFPFRIYGFTVIFTVHFVNPFVPARPWQLGQKGALPPVRYAFRKRKKTSPRASFKLNFVFMFVFV